jgi:hypothetical protein
LALDPARLWCQALARTLRVERIHRDGKPYLNRYFVAGWSPYNRRSGPAVFLHHFVASDAYDTLHSHPWGWSLSVILVGGYREERCGDDGVPTVKQYRPGDVNALEPSVRHRVDLLEADCWTLFLAGNFEQAWQFSPRC